MSPLDTSSSKLDLNDNSWAMGSTLYLLSFGQQRRVGTSAKLLALIATSRKPSLHQESVQQDRKNPLL